MLARLGWPFSQKRRESRKNGAETRHGTLRESYKTEGEE